MILAYSILIINVTTVGIPFDPEPGILVLATQPEKAASLAGLEPGDKILEIQVLLLKLKHSFFYIKQFLKNLIQNMEQEHLES